MLPLRISSRFICLEGTDYSGKTTILQALAEHFEERGIEYIKTREPGGCELAEKIRSMVLSTDMLPMTELLLFMAARNEHLHTIVLPALREGKVVLSDRFLGSSFAYQGEGKQLGMLAVQEAFKLLLLSDPAVSTVLSYHTQTFVLDLDHGTAMLRGRRRGDAPNRLDVLDYTQFTLMRNAYRNLPRFCDLFKRNFHIINADSSPQTLASLILYTALGDKNE